ncbi:MAG: phosphoglycerate dehydrogenase [Candidatus Latescibacterota bacterium]|nr:phosphoglycerate dehydrogenase [Candidatus Latescibacterota bacterium]
MSSTPSAIITVSMDFNGRRPAADLFDTAGIAWKCEHGSSGWPEEETIRHLQGVNAIIAGGERFDATTMAAANLKIIARNGVGFDRVDLNYCTERGVVVTNTPGAMSDAVADHAFALLLAVARGIVSGDRNVKEGGYEIGVYEDLPAMTLGLMGCGHIGAEVVRRALGFRMRVLVHDPWIDPQRVRDLGAEPVERNLLLAESDAISLHVPLTTENEKIIDTEFISAMKKGSILVNTARGGLVDESALIEALRNGHLLGAGVDCQATEPPVGETLELVRLDNVVAMPHCASKTLTARYAMSKMAAESIVDVLQGRVPEHVVNRDVIERIDLEPR